MKDAKKEQHGFEANTEYARRGLTYDEWRELAPQRPTFGETNKTGAKNAGHDKSWNDAKAKTSVQGDGNPGPVTPVSGGEDDTVKKRRSQYEYVADDKKYSPEFSRIPDAGKKWQATPFFNEDGSPALFANQGPQTPANKREIQIGWRKRYAAALSDGESGPATVGPGVKQTPQRKKQRATEDK